MTRTMYDAVTAANVPADATLVAGYGDGYYQDVEAFRARFPHATVVEIAVSSHHNLGQVLDVETGDATPAEAPGWVSMRRAAGVDPSVYCNSSTWPQVRAAFTRAGVAEPHWWIAQYDGNPTIFPGAVAKQYADPGPYDLSAVADYWPGVDPQEDDMPYTPAELVGFAQQGALAALTSQPGRDAGAFANLWWLEHALAGTTSSAMTSGQADLIRQMHQLVTQLAALGAPHAAATAAVTDLQPAQEEDRKSVV